MLLNKPVSVLSRKLTLISCVLIFGACGSSPFVEVDPSQVDDKTKFVADKVYRALFDICAENNFEQLIDYDFITPKMYQIIRGGGFKDTCPALAFLGNAKEKELPSVLFHKGILKIFRYKVKFDNYETPVEVRITLNVNNKLSEFRFYEWKDKYEHDLVEMHWFG
ncbi:MAG: hypothetical protein AAFX87_23295 [Bacteroidota bacterium]